MEKKSKKKKEKNPWESDDGSGAKSSSAEEQFEELDKEKVMEDHRKAMGSGHIDALVDMDPNAVEEMLMRCRENMTGYGVVEFDVDGEEKK